MDICTLKCQPECYDITYLSSFYRLQVRITNGGNAFQVIWVFPSPVSLSQKLTECWYKFWNKALLICCFRKGGRKSSLALLWGYPPREKLPYRLWNMEVAPNCVFSLPFGNALVSVWMHFLTFQKEFPAVPQTCNAWQTRPSDKCTKHKCAKHSCTHTPKNSRRVFLPGSTAICQLPTPEVL